WFFYGGLSSSHSNASHFELGKSETGMGTKVTGFLPGSVRHDGRIICFGLCRFCVRRAREQVRTTLFAFANSAVVRHAFRVDGNQHIDGCSCIPGGLGCGPRAWAFHWNGATRGCVVATTILVIHGNAFHGSRGSSGRAERGRSGSSRQPETVG